MGKKLFDPPLQFFRSFAQKSTKIKERFWESFEVVSDLKHCEIDY
jgi:hypothetical protein